MPRSTVRYVNSFALGSTDFPFLPWHQSVHCSFFPLFFVLNRSHHRCRWATQLKSCLVSEDSQTLGRLLCRGSSSLHSSSQESKVAVTFTHTLSTLPPLNKWMLFNTFETKLSILRFNAGHYCMTNISWQNKNRVSRPWKTNKQNNIGKAEWKKFQLLKSK